MMVATMNGHLNIVQFLLEHKADQDSSTFIPKRSTVEGRNHPYLIGMLPVADVRRLDIGCLLLEYKADVNISSSIYRGAITALTHAAMQDSPELNILKTHQNYQFMAFLISNGALCSPKEFSYLHEKTKQTIFSLFEKIQF